MLEAYMNFMIEANENNPWLYAIGVLVTMAVLGISIGILADLLFKLLGIKLEKIEHH